MERNLLVRIRSLPTGVVLESNFELGESAIPVPDVGEVLVRNRYLSLDPYMRKRLADAVAGRVALGPGDLMMGRTVGEVVESRDRAFRAGDQVLGWGGWQRYSAEVASRLEKVEAIPGADASVHLGVLGRPGITAWLGIVHVAQLRAGERLVVSSAAGAVGSLASQMARHLGADVVGIAGGPSKCEAVVRELGLRACVDYKAPGFVEDFAIATPAGLDVCFENVGGAVLDAAFDRMNTGGRIAVCGLIDHYHSGPAYGFRNFARVLDRRLVVTGFGIDALAPLHQRARAQLYAWFEQGAVRSWETVTRGLAQAPAAFVAMLQGRGRGKTIVQVS